MTPEDWENVWITLVALAMVGIGWIFLETVVKRRFMRRIWDHDLREWTSIFGYSREFFIKRRGPRP